MKIGELAAKAGVNASAIRYYERIGLLAGPLRKGGQRRYAPAALPRVLLIRFASDMGFSLDEIRLFLSALRDDAPVGERWKKLARSKIRELDTRIARSLELKALLQRLLRCRCASLEICTGRLSLSPAVRSLSRGSR